MDILRKKLLQIHGDADFVDRLVKSKVLLVGAGGIGCEVIKGLLLCGFPDVTILDLDTIDVSNLNRQFLFQKCHVGESKAKVASRVSIERFSHRNPETKEPLSVVRPIHDSILEMKYGKSFYEQFTFVINALDNDKTRVHVNRLCLAGNVPLVESGSTGYKGNLRMILPGKTECFECNGTNKEEKTYASCTIRHTPSAPIHCIVWAKHLFAQLFGEADEDIAPDGAGANLTNGDGHKENGEKNGEENEKMNGEENGGKNGQENGQENGEKTESTREYVERIGYEPRGVFQKIFHHDIVYLKNAFPHMWENRKPPQEISYDDILSGDSKFGDVPQSQMNGNPKTEIDLQSNAVLRDQRLWPIEDCLQNFTHSLTMLRKRLAAMRPGDSLSWDKDDDDALSFVTAASNFRCYIFSIERKSKFDVKSLAGNIIPAIPSTNTVVGGCVLIQSMKLLRSLAQERFQTRNDQWSMGQESADKESSDVLNNCIEAYITNANHSGAGKVVSMSKPNGPKAKCLACSKSVHQINIGLPLDGTSVVDFVNEIVIKKLHCFAPDVIVFGSDTVLWGPDLDELIEMHKKTPKMLSEYKELNGDGDHLLLIEDIAQDYSVHVKLVDMEIKAEDNNEMFYKILNEDELEKMAESGESGEKIVNETPDKTEDKEGVVTLDYEDCLIETEIFVGDKSATSVDVNAKANKRALDNENGYDESPIKKLRTEHTDIPQMEL